MDTPAKSARTNLAIQVFQQTQSGMTVCDACKKVGLARSSFYFIVQHNPEAFSEIQEFIKASKRIELTKLLYVYQAVVDKTIEDALSELTSPKVRLALLKYIDKRVDELTRKHGVQGKNDKAVQRILSGPTRELAKSRFGGEPPSLP